MKIGIFFQNCKKSHINLIGSENLKNPCFYSFFSLSFRFNENSIERARISYSQNLPGSHDFQINVFKSSKMIIIGEDRHYMSRMTSHADIPIYKKDWTDTTFTPGKAFLVVSMSILNVFMLLGNIASIVTIATSSRLRKQVSYWFVLNLAITDTFISVTVVPLNTVWEYYGIWPLGKKACEFVTFADISLSTVSAYSIVLVSIDKYIYITHAIQYHNHMTKRVALILILIVWTGVCIFSSISIFAGLASSYFEETLPNTCIYVMHDTHVVPATVITFFIPLLILSYTTSRIICIAKKHIKRIHATPSFSGTAGTLN